MNKTGLLPEEDKRIFCCDYTKSRHSEECRCLKNVLILERTGGVKVLVKFL
jgi:hypothetical protein